MKMNKSLLALIAGATFAMTASTAQAGGLLGHGSDVSLKDAPPIVDDTCCTANWRGLYAAAGIGAGSVTHEIGANITIPALIGIDATLNGIGGEGIIGAFQLGFDTVLRHHGRNFVIGGFVEYELSGIETELDFTFNGLTGGADLQHDYSLSIGARAGFVHNCCTLWYGTIGYSHVAFDDINLNFGPGATGTFDFPDFDALFLGAGVETQVAGNIYLKGEYRYTHGFSEEIVNINLGGGGAFVLDDEPSFHTGRVSLVYRLGGSRGGQTEESFK